MQQLKASIYVLIGAISYGFLSTIIKLAYQNGYTTADVVGSQLLFGFLGFLLCGMNKWAEIVNIKPASIVALFLSGIITSLTGIFYYLSLRYLQASFAVILLFQFTWMGIILEWIVKGIKPTLNKIISIIIVLSGTFITTFASSINNFSNFSFKGIIFGLLSALTYTIFIYISGNVASKLPSLTRSLLTTAGGFTFSLFIFPPHYLINGKLLSGLWLYGLFLGLFGMMLPVYLFAKGVPHTSPGLASILGSIELPTVIILSTIILNEPVTIKQWVGVSIILLGIVNSVVKQPLK